MKSPHPPSPHLIAAQQGDPAAFCILMQEHERQLLAQALGLCRNPALAEDLVQETLLEAWKHLARFNHTSRLSTWLYAILLHRHQKALRAAKIRPFFTLTASQRELALARLHALNTPPDEALQQKETAADLHRLIYRLPPAQRHVIRLRFFADASLEEIAAVLHCSPGTVKSRLFYAMESLRKMAHHAKNLNPDLPSGDSTSNA